ncbi:replication-relaxation family protein [Heyndrickxia oleronia]|uniref:replication-relaxation family protein n=1 Tax=Heyndrickxia oleronia TaxID=38875 RepID=UPI00203FAE01|nr:replication-relaxation family protein [Heyndrickxia oleronia]MCM3456553.1 replication-relaxation family protein [Heyndrickxia oleronia]
MKKRDLDILNSLEKFKCLTRDQIAALHFSKNAYPHIAANNVLKRLRRDEYITANTDRSFQQYIYFLNPSRMKTDSQKIDHFLMIAQGYIDMMKFSPLVRYEIEPKIDDATFIPDVHCRWLDNDWFLEFQNSLYTVKQLYTKLDKYKEYHDKGYWKNERVLIIGKINLKFDPNDYPFKIKQIKCFSELEHTINRFKNIKNIDGISIKIG